MLEGLEDAFGNDTPSDDKDDQPIEAPVIVKKTFKSDNVIDYNVCIKNKMEEQRSSWCGDKYDGDLPVLKACKHNFCTFCCEANIRTSSFF